MNEEENASVGWSVLTAGAIYMREMYLELRNAGFTRYEALLLVAMLVANANPEAGS